MTDNKKRLVIYIFMGLMGLLSVGMFFIAMNHHYSSPPGVKKFIKMLNEDIAAPTAREPAPVMEETPEAEIIPEAATMEEEAPVIEIPTETPVLEVPTQTPTLETPETEKPNQEGQNEE